jgi:hypothetical protein
VFEHVVDDDQVKRFGRPRERSRISHATIEPEGIRIARQRSPRDIDSRAVPASSNEIPQKVAPATPHVQHSGLSVVAGRRLLTPANHARQHCWPDLRHSFHAGYELAAALTVVFGWICHILGRNVSEAHEAALLAHT